MKAVTEALSVRKKDLESSASLLRSAKNVISIIFAHLGCDSNLVDILTNQEALPKSVRAASRLRQKTVGVLDVDSALGEIKELSPVSPVIKAPSFREERNSSSEARKVF